MATETTPSAAVVAGATPVLATVPSAAKAESSTGTMASSTNHPLIGPGGDLASNRLSNTTACLPIVYGSAAFFLGKKAGEFSTHKWTLYLRGPNNEDLSSCISKVVFQLHPSFTQPVREILEPPFEVTERGWGEFEAQIRIVWKDPSEKATIVTHGIKLYPPGSTSMQPTKEPVVAETYDEVVFTDPRETFFQQLMRVADLPKIASADQTVQECFQLFSDQDDFQKLIEAQRFLKKELEQVKARMRIVDDEMDQVDASLREVHEAKQRVSTAARATAVQQQKPKAAMAAPVRAPSPAKKAKVGS